MLANYGQFLRLSLLTLLILLVALEEKQVLYTCFFCAKFLLDHFLTFTPLSFCLLRNLKCSHSQNQVAEVNWRQFSTKNQMIVHRNW